MELDVQREVGVRLKQNLSSELPIVLWNHRWDYDKCPQVFFDVLERARQKGAKFRLVVLGENLLGDPEVFTNAKKSLSRS